MRQIAKSADFGQTWFELWRHFLMAWHDIDLKFTEYVYGGITIFTVIRRVWRELFANIHGKVRFTLICGPFDPSYMRALKTKRAFWRALNGTRFFIWEKFIKWHCMTHIRWKVWRNVRVTLCKPGSWWHDSWSNAMQLLYWSNVYYIWHSFKINLDVRKERYNTKKTVKYKQNMYTV